jgi:hypothetical protein
MLRPLLRQNAISVWDDSHIKPGDQWQREIEQALARANVAVLLVSADFLNSDYIAEQELLPLLKAAKENGVTILWVYLKNCLFEETPVKDYQAAHNIDKPIEALDAADQNAELKLICKSIKNAYKTEPIAPKSSKIFNQYQLKLPYLCDRSEQRLDLQQALLDHQQNNPHRPFLFIVHGHEHECHAEFLEVVKEHELKVALALDQKQVSILEHILEWPFEAPAKDFVKRIRQRISSTICNIVGKNDYELTAAIANHQAPIIFKVEIIDGTDHSEFDKKLQAFFKLWNEWPDLPSGCVLMIALVAKYRINADFAASIQSLRLNQYKNLHGLRLPELRPIKEPHVHDWNNRHNQLHKNRICELFANSAEGIPMELLVEKLQFLIQA